MFVIVGAAACAAVQGQSATPKAKRNRRGVEKLGFMSFGIARYRTTDPDSAPLERDCNRNVAGFEGRPFAMPTSG